MQRLCIIPRWAGSPEKDYYPWLRAALDGQSPRMFDEVLSPEMPDPGTPTLEGWVGRVREIVGTDKAALANTVLLGHSVGCQAVLRFVAGLSEGTRVRGILCVAGWFWVDKPWETIRPWMDTPLDDAAVRGRAERIVVMMSDNDPFTADHAANADAWRKRLGAEVVPVPGAKHFNEAEEPAVLETLMRYFGT